ncbi:CrcB family protein [Aquipuribacter hungaricus]|uniref:Fluoride-specific ion channel n=1 Tax=Aquipuribacter hungaricus TaxID=545624 RepID=A0ABV7WB88_9MICO
MTGLDQGVGTGLVVALLAALVVGAGLGSVLRAVVLARVGASPGPRVRALGSAWANVPATAVAAALLVVQTRLGLLPGTGPDAAAVGVVLLLGVCGGMSTWSTLALELARSVLADDRRALALQVGGAVVGVLAGLFGAGLAVLLLLAAG